MDSALYTTYKQKIVPELLKEQGYRSVMQVPKVAKVVVNIGYGRHAKEKPFIDRAEKTIELITGQRPIKNKSKKSISNFKIREGMEIGSSVILRGKQMYEFLYKLVNLTLPRVRDFRGLPPKAFDGNGNYTIGFKEQLAFPEISGDAADHIHGLQVVISTTAKNDAEGRALLEKIGLPFRQK